MLLLLALALEHWSERTQIPVRLLEGQACTWVWDDWDDRDSKGIWEVYSSIYIANAHLLIPLYIFASKCALNMYIDAHVS